MAIRITCNQCTTSFTVGSDRAGLLVACPTCTKEHRIPAPTLANAAPTTVQPTPEDGEFTLSPVVKRPSPVPYSATEPIDDRPAPTSATAKSPAVTPDTAAADAPTCERCGKVHTTRGELCPHCFYHSGLKRVVDIRDHDDPLLSEHGFRRFLLAKLNKDQSPEGVFFLLDAMVFLAGVLLYVMGHSLAVVLVPIVVMYLIYRIAVRTGRLWYSGRSLLWYSVLILGRALSWRTLGGQDRKHATHRGTEFGDDDLKKLAELSSYAVIDLDGTAITDEGLAPLKNHDALQFLILRKTQVTAEGVWELQKTIPHTCIWY